VSLAAPGLPRPAPQARNGDEKVTVVVDRPLFPLLRLILTEGRDAAATLEPYGMGQGRFLALGSAPIPPESGSVLFLIRPRVEAAHWVRDKLLRRRETDALWTASVCFVPRRSFDCEAVWQAAGVWAALSGVHELVAPLVPWDDDLLTMEWPDLWCSAALRSSPAAAEHVAQSLLDLQTVFGPIPDIKAKGDVACRALELMLTKRRHLLVETGDAAEAAAAAAGGSSAAPPPEPSSLVARAAAAAAGVGPIATAGSSSAAAGDTSAAGDRASAAEGAAAAGSGAAAAEESAAARAEPVEGGRISAAVVIDRDVDPVTPLLHSLTVEALLDDLIGISGGVATLAGEIAGGLTVRDAEKARSEGSVGPPAEVFLNSDEREWTSVRDMHIHAATRVIGRRATELQAFQDSAASLRRDKDLKAMRAYVDQLKGFEEAKRALPRVMALTRVLKEEAERADFMEEWRVMTDPFAGGDARGSKALADRLVARRATPHRPLRLQCIASAAEGGLRQRDVDSWRRSLVESYGFEFALVPDTLEGMGLLRVNRAAGLFGGGGAGDWNWSALVRGFRLNEDAGEEASPVDTSFVTSCVAPLSVRIVQAALALPIGAAAMEAVGPDSVASSFPPQGGWSAVEASLRSCPGRALECLQLRGPKSMARRVGISAPGGPAGAAAGAASIAGKLGPLRRGVSAETRRSGSAGGGREAEDDADDQEDQDEPRKTVLVYFVGGVTFAEVAALRWLGERLPFDFLIATTHITSGRKLMEQAIEAAKLGEPADLVPSRD